MTRACFLPLPACLLNLLPFDQRHSRSSPPDSVSAASGSGSSGGGKRQRDEPKAGGKKPLPWPKKPMKKSRMESDSEEDEDVREEIEEEVQRRLKAAAEARRLVKEERRQKELEGALSKGNPFGQQADQPEQ